MPFFIIMNTENEYMKEALKEAYKAKEIDEVPIGAVVVRNGEIIARAHNMKEHDQLASSHAEHLALTKAQKLLGTWNLQDCDLYVTLEPCMMCTGAIMESRIKETKFLLNRTDVCFRPDSFIKIQMIDDKKMCDKYLKLIQKFFVNKRY